MNPRLAGLVVLAVLILAIVGYLSFRPGEQGVSSSLQQTTTVGVARSLNWITYHSDNSRSGDALAVNFTTIVAGWKSSQLDGQIYAEPLVLGNSVFVATENNSVYSLNATTGAILWHDNLGSPVQGSALQCGDIDPSGITGTPVIDPVNRLIYVVALLSPPHHVLFAIGVDDGKIRFQQQADPQGMDTTVQQQRAALSLANGYVYIPYGGLYGDCGDYHGWVVGISADGSGGAVSYQVPTTREGGIWAPSGAAIDSSGNLYVATGNGDSTSAFDHGDSVIELSPSLQEVGFFAPTNWAQLNAADNDLGTSGPTLVGNRTLFQIGKEGVGYLLNATNLGGIGGQIFSTRVCNSVYGGLAYSKPFVFVPCTDGLVAVQVDGSSFRIAWRSAEFFAGPPIVTGGAVWTVDRAGSLHVFSLDGKEMFTSSVGSVDHFVTPSCGGNEVFVAAGNQLLAFDLA